MCEPLPDDVSRLSIHCVACGHDWFIIAETDASHSVPMLYVACPQCATMAPLPGVIRLHPECNPNALYWLFKESRSESTT